MKKWILGALGCVLACLAWGQTSEPTEKWVFEAQSNLYAPPLTADVHASPGLETVLSDSEAKRLCCVDARGALLWEYRGGWQKRLISAAALTPAQGNRPPLLAVGNADGRLCVVDASTGKEWWQGPVGLVEWGGAMWADLDGDGVSEIVVGTEDQGVVALNADGQVRWTYRGKAGAPGCSVRCPMAAEDVNGDGRVELFGCGTYGPFCLNAEGGWQWESVTGDDFSSAPVIADADRDGQAELYAVSRQDNMMWSFDATTGAIRWSSALMAAPDMYPGSSIAVGDIDGDGRAEIVAGDIAGHLQAYSSDGSLRWVYCITKPSHLCASLGDVDGDQQVDVLAVSGDHCLYGLDGEGIFRWKVSTALRLIHPPTLADIDLDGITEVLVCGSDRRLRCLTLGGKYRPEWMPWPSRRHDSAQTGSAFRVGGTSEGRVLEARSLFNHGGFEQDKTVDVKSPFPEGSELAAQRMRLPRGWTPLTHSGVWGLDDGRVFEGKRALRLAQGKQAATDFIAVAPGLRSIAVTSRVWGALETAPEIEWIGVQGSLGRVTADAAAASSDAEWLVWRAEGLTPPRHARWMRLVVSAPRTGECWLDGVEITGMFDVPREAKVLVNQVGYDTGAPKWFTAQSNWVASQASFVLLRDDQSEAYRGTLTHAGRIKGYFGQDWGQEYWRGDFTAFDTPGHYRIRIEMDGAPSDSWPFDIGAECLWTRTAYAGYRFFYYQRCGMAIPGFHGACHLDDAAGPDGKGAFELWGGWHDAGDYNKYHNAPYVYGLARAYGVRMPAFGAQDKDGNGLGDLLDEILWGGEHARRMVSRDGSAYGGITSGYGYWGPPELETDNVPGTGDERRMTGQETGADPSQHHAALARIATYVSDPSAWVEPAARSLQWALDHQIRGLLQFSTAVDLYAVTKDPKYAALAKELLPKPAAAADVVDVLERYDAVFGEAHGAAIRTVLMARAEEMLPLAANPFGVYTMGPADRPNFFGTPADHGGWHVGTSSYLMEAANLMALAYRYQPDPRYLQFVYDQFNWTLGVNPFDISLMEGQGSAFAPSYHQRLTFAGLKRGAVPGSVVNGITWRSAGDDRPYFDMSGVDIPAFEPNEAWLPHNTAYVNAVANLYSARQGATAQ